MKTARLVLCIATAALVCAVLPAIAQTAAPAGSAPDSLAAVPQDSTSTDERMEYLQETVFLGEKRQVVYKLDRQSISASSDISASGGTAVDILKSSPSVLVDSEGNLTLRGSGNFLVYVDGKLSPLEGSDALRQIPSASIEDIEIITTPSARYRSDSDAAIINIKTKKSVAAGWNGMFSTFGGTLGEWGADGTVNYREGRHNFYAGGTFQQLKGRSGFTQHKHTNVMGVESTSISDGERWRNYGTYTGRAGWQYSDGSRHNLSLDFTGGVTCNWRGGDMLYDEHRRTVSEASGADATYNSHDRYRLEKHYFQASLDYLWHISDKSDLALQNRFRYDPYSIEYTESNMFELGGRRYEGTRGYEEEHHWDCDGLLTFIHRYSGTGKFEAGYQYTTYSEHGGYRITYWDRAQERFEWQYDLATPFYYRRQVHSVYALASDSFGKLSAEAGLRGDEVVDQMDIEIKDASRHITRFDLFPSAHLRFDGGRAGTFSAGYSFRTNRPGIWQLEPYITYEDYYTKKTGNPDIRPEYIHSAELGWRISLPRDGSLAVTAFCKFRRDISDWVRTAYEPGVTLDQIVNAGNQREKGLEAIWVVKPARWWTSTLGGSVSGYDFTATDPACSDASGLAYLANWNNMLSLSKTFKLQFDGHYVGPVELTQGSEGGYCFFELAARQSLLKDRMSVALVAHDTFRTAKYHNERHSSGLDSVTDVLPKYPAVVLSLSYNFNSPSHKSSDSRESVLFEGKDF